MNNLEERVKKMLKGESRRRETAIKWVEEIVEILKPVSEDIWGTGDEFGGIPSNTITLTKVDKDLKKKDTCIYFRYKTYEAVYKTEGIGFYDASQTECNLRGISIEDLRGKEFWYAIQVIMDWIPQLVQSMDKREDSRDALLDRLK